MREIGFERTHEECVMSDIELSEVNTNKLQNTEPSQPKDWNPKTYPTKGYGIMIYNNNHSTIEDVILNVMKLSRLTVNEALFVAQYVHERGSAFISVVDEEKRAEVIVKSLQSVGIHANHFTD